MSVCNAWAICRPEECLQLLEQVMPWEDDEDLLGGIEHLLLEDDNQPVRRLVMHLKITTSTC
jgi:hypothetical protein